MPATNGAIYTKWYAAHLVVARAVAAARAAVPARLGRVSPRRVSDLKRGTNSTAKDTAVLLAHALGLARRVSGLFVAATRGGSRLGTWPWLPVRIY